MVNVRMLKTALGSMDGITTKRYEEGKTYEINDSLANDFLSFRACEIIVPEAARETQVILPETKETVKTRKPKGAK